MYNISGCFYHYRQLALLRHTHTHTHTTTPTGPAVWYAGQMEPQVGSFSQYLYFLFCPTLLYRDNYPRWGRLHVYSMKSVPLCYIIIQGEWFYQLVESSGLLLTGVRSMHCFTTSSETNIVPNYSSSPYSSMDWRFLRMSCSQVIPVSLTIMLSTVSVCSNWLPIL